MSFFVQLKCNPNIYLKDPLQSELGRKIITYAIELIDELGLEDFNFKKLAAKIESTEATIYRYFENKHKLLIYLTNWYWAWLEYQIDYQTHNISDPHVKMDIIIKEIANCSNSDPNVSHIDESILHRIVVSESAKAYLNKRISEEQDLGYYSSYASLCKKLGAAILELNPSYPYPRTLASNMIETAHEQLFFSQHLPQLTDLRNVDENNNDIYEFLTHLVAGLVLNQPELKSL